MIKIKLLNPWSIGSIEIPNPTWSNLYLLNPKSVWPILVLRILIYAFCWIIQLTPEVEQQLLQQVMSLTPEQINLLPPEQRHQVHQLQQMLRQWCLHSTKSTATLLSPYMHFIQLCLFKLLTCRISSPGLHLLSLMS